MKKGKIAIIVASKNFRDEEYFVPREIFEENGFQVDTFSDKEGPALGADGGVVNALDMEKIDYNDYLAIMIVGGPGALKYLDQKSTYELLRDFFEAEKVVAAICIAPVILAYSGILKGKQATVWSSGLDKSAVKKLKGEGVEYLNEKVVVDGNIITGDGPDSATEFAEKLVKMLG